MDTSDPLMLDEAAVVTTPERPSGAGLTTRVVRGTLWNIGGQGASLIATLIATPFVIRLLGSELYGLLALINVLLGFLAFADVGMGWASTRFASEAHGRGDDEQEAKVVWTAVLMAAGPSSVFAIAVIVGARFLIEQILRLPVHLHEVSIIALRIAAVTFVARALAGVMNTPELSRLRMDLVVLINVGTMIAQLLLVPLVLFLGGGLPEALTVMAGSAILALTLHILVGMRLLPALRRPRVDLALLKPLARYGGGVLITAFATIVLGTVDKVFLSRYVSVQALAYYAVAFNLSFMLTQAPLAMVQTLIPAFSHLQTVPERRGELQALYWRALRGTLLWVAPAVVFICVIARPFFTFWAGPEFGRESTPLMYVLAVGFGFEAIAYVPFALLMAVGRTDLVARCHGSFVIPYLILSALSIRWYGAMGAAVVCSLRAIASMVAFALIASRKADLSFSLLPENIGAYLISMAVLIVPVTLAAWAIPSVWVRIGVAVVALAVHGVMVFTRVLAAEERAWLSAMLMNGPWRRLLSGS